MYNVLPLPFLRLLNAWTGCRSILSAAIKHFLSLETLPTTYRLGFNVYEKDTPLNGSGILVIYNSLPRDLLAVHSVAVKGIELFEVRRAGIWVSRCIISVWRRRTPI